MKIEPLILCCWVDIYYENHTWKEMKVLCDEMIEYITLRGYKGSYRLVNRDSHIKVICHPEDPNVDHADFKEFCRDLDHMFGSKDVKIVNPNC